MPIWETQMNVDKFAWKVLSDSELSEYEAALARIGFAHAIREISKLMCEEMCIDPNQMVVRPISHMTLPTENALDGSEVLCARHELMRPHAALALAGFRSVQRYILEEGDEK